jgi:CheY-like chemotaxis protein
MPTRILIADDNGVARDRLREQLSNHDGWEVCAVVEDGRQAVEKAAELKPSLIILDLAMPVMDGLSAAREIGRILPSVPVVLFTLHKLPVLELEAKKAGVRQVVEKPDFEALLEVIEGLLKKTQTESSPETTAPFASLSTPLDVTDTLRVQPPPSESQTKEPSEPDSSTMPN